MPSSVKVSKGAKVNAGSTMAASPLPALMQEAQERMRIARRPTGNDGRPVRVFLHHTIGWSAPGNIKTRLIRQDLVDNGWGWYIEKLVRPALPFITPIDGVMLHNPFGCLPAENMQADQAIHALTSDAARLAQTFDQFWYSLAQEREVVAYLGNLARDAEFSAYASAKDAAEYLYRLQRSYFQVLKAGCSVGFDVLVDLPEHHPAVNFVRLLQSLGTRCYAEPFPAAGDAHLADLPIIVMEDQYQQHYARPGSWPSWALPRQQLQGEIVRVWNRYDHTLPPPAQDAQQIAFVRECWKAGHSCAIAGEVLTNAQQSIDQLVNAGT